MWKREKIIHYRTDAPAVQAQPWAKPATEATPEIPYSEATRTTPARPATIESDVAVPLMQTLVSGVLALLVAAAICFAADWDWRISLVTAGIVICVAWAYLLFDGRKLLRTVEKFVGVDLDGDGHQGEPPEPEKVLRIEVGQNNTTYWLDVPHNKVVKFAGSITKTGSMSEAEWKDFFGGIKEFKGFRGRLLGAGLVRWKNDRAHAQGVELTPAGRKVFERLAKLPPAEQ